MTCTRCKKKDAFVHFNGIIDGKAVQLDLCEDCAKKSGLTASFNFPSAVQPALNDLMDVLSSWHQQSSGAVKSACPVCRWTMAQFQKTGRMGCSECYLHFHKEAESFLKKIHGATTHKGKKAPAEVAKTKVRDREKSLSRLKMDLEKAVREEQYELAASLRDKIRDFEKRTV